MATLTRNSHLLSFFARIKCSPNINGFGVYNIFRGFITARGDEQPEYISVSRVKQVLRYEDLIPALERSFVNFSDRDCGGIIQPVRLQVPVKQGHQTASF